MQGTGLNEFALDRAAHAGLPSNIRIENRAAGETCRFSFRSNCDGEPRHKRDARTFGQGRY